MKKGLNALAAAIAAIVSGTVVAQDANAPMEEVLVIGSRIPRVQEEGPSPITVIDASQIESAGLTNVPDLLKALTQNGGATQSQQSFSGNDFTPGAQQATVTLTANGSAV